MEAKYNQPLWKTLFLNLPGQEVDIEALMKPAAHWLDCRLTNGDVNAIDPSMEPECQKARELQDLSRHTEQLVKDNDKTYASEAAKVSAAAEAMIAMQVQRIQEFSTVPVEDSPIFKVNKQNIEVWKANKMQVLDKAHQCLVNDSVNADNAMTGHVQHVIEKAYETWLQHSSEHPTVGVDPALMGELEAIMETTVTAEDAPWFN